MLLVGVQPVQSLDEFRVATVLRRSGKCTVKRCLLPFRDAAALKRVGEFGNSGMGAHGKRDEKVRKRCCGSDARNSLTPAAAARESFLLRPLPALG